MVTALQAIEDIGLRDHQYMKFTLYVTHRWQDVLKKAVFALRCTHPSTVSREFLRLFLQGKLKDNKHRLESLSA